MFCEAGRLDTNPRFVLLTKDQFDILERDGTFTGPTFRGTCLRCLTACMIPDEPYVLIDVHVWEKTNLMVKRVGCRTGNHGIFIDRYDAGIAVDFRVELDSAHLDAFEAEIKRFGRDAVATASRLLAEHPP